MSAWGCLPRERSACRHPCPLDPEADTPSRGQTDTCKNNTFPQLLLRTVIKVVLVLVDS